MLHKISKLQGFHILAKDGECGHVDDVLVDESMKTHDLVVDTSNWIGGKSVLVSAEAVELIDSPHKEIRVRMTKDEIAHCPTVDTADIELIETLPPPII
jgi:hypothetical protein